MKISKLIELLQGIQAINGDLPVDVGYDACMIDDLREENIEIKISGHPAPELIIWAN